jgi:hypothetical protein
MRLPLMKVYRAFRELDQFSDAECRRYIGRIQRRRTIGCLPFLVGFAVGPFWLMFLIVLTSTLRRPPNIVVALVVATSLIWGPAIIGLLARDWVLIRAIRKQIDNARCPKCDYSLLGLTVRNDDTGRAWVQCPECGAKHFLLNLNLSPEDLFPQESDVSADPSALTS